MIPTQAEVAAPPRALRSVLPHLAALVELSGSDLHCKVGSPPRVRIDGRLRRLEAPELTAADVEAMLAEVLREDLREEFARTGEAHFAHSLPGVGRFRVSAFRQRGSAGLVFHRVVVGAVPLDDLGLPPAVADLALEPRGLVLVTGPAGSGRTTTLAGMVDHVNSSREVHIVTVEDPIEVLHADKLGMVNQREVRVDTAGFGSALRAVLRQDPDVVLVGELQDADSVRAALSAAESGHLVLSALATNDAAETVTRLVDLFRPHERAQVRLGLAASLRGVVSQRLVPRADGQGRCVAMEVCLGTQRVVAAVADPALTPTLGDIVADSGSYGMQTLEQHLVALVRDGVVAVEEALAVAGAPQDLTVELRRLGLVV